MKRISHWIDGRIVEGTSGRTGPVWNPATGAQQAEVDFASAAEVDAAVDGRARRAFPAWRAHEPVAPGRGPVPPARADRRQPQGDRVAAHRRARQGALRRARRGGAWPRERRVRLRHPAPAEGRALGAGVDGHRRVPAPPAARRGRRHHAVQLPGDGPHVDARQRARRAATRSSSSRRRRTRPPRSSWPSCCTRPGCPTGASTWCTATARRSTASSSTPTSRR